MELSELKKSWKSQEESQLKSNEIALLMQQRGKGILSRLDRNVRTGLWVLGLFILITLADQLIPSQWLLPEQIEDSVTIPLWITLTGWFVNLVMITIFLLFVFRYRRMKLTTLINSDLPTAIRKTLDLLRTFKREFYLALALLLSGSTLGFLAGALQGYDTLGTTLPARQNIAIETSVIIILLTIGLIVSIFYIFHLGFRSLYGQYQHQLDEMLKELDEQ